MTEFPTPTELPAIGFLACLSEEHRSFLSCFGRFLRPAAGDVLIHEGDSQTSLYVILSGTLHVVSEAEGRPVLIASLGEGSVLGEVNLFDPATASASVVVRAGGLVWALDRDEMEGFVEADPVAGLALFRALLAQSAKRIRTMNEKLATADQKSTLHHYWDVKGQ